METTDEFRARSRETNPSFGVHKAAYSAFLVRLHQHPNFVQHRSVDSYSLHRVFSVMTLGQRFHAECMAVAARPCRRIVGDTGAILARGIGHGS